MMRAPSEKRTSLSLYLHFPFCVRKCRYCDFLSAPAGEEARQDYIDTLCAEIALRGEQCRGEAPEAQIVSLFIGGGTPSLMSAAQLDRVMETVRRSFSLLPDAECSMEVNPGTADLQKLRAYRECGMNRLSIGVQSLHDRELALLGRIHTAAQAEEIFRAARDAGFSNLNVDLMSALPGQTFADWKYTLETAVSWGPEHISAYSLQIEEGTPFYTMELPPLPAEDEDREMYHFTRAFLAEHGIFRYEISNYAAPGYECIHNKGYWTGRPYLGLGTGAASLFGNCRFHNPSDYALYKAAVTNRDLPALMCEKTALSPQDRMEEFMFLGLRLTEGVSERDFLGRFGVPIGRVYGEVLEKHLKEGGLEKKGERYRLTEYGKDVANTIMAEYLL